MVDLLHNIASGIMGYLFYFFLNRLYSFFTQCHVVFTCVRAAEKKKIDQPCKNNIEQRSAAT